jgi:hypothetical protein
MENIKVTIIKFGEKKFSVILMRVYISNIYLHSKDFIQNKRKKIFKTHSVEIKWNLQYRHYICSGVMTPFLWWDNVPTFLRS